MTLQGPRSFPFRLALALAAALMAPACAGPAAPATPAAATRAPAAAAQAPVDPLTQLPRAPDTTPSPWVPFAVERALGAECPTEPYGNPRISYIHSPCHGLLPEHLARVLLAIPEGVMHLPLEDRRRQLKAPIGYVAAPGRGARPDFMAANHQWTIRSFEGITPADTVYFIEGPFGCSSKWSDNEYDATPTCAHPFGGQQYFAWREGDRLVNVTQDIEPKEPVRTPAEIDEAKQHGGDGFYLDMYKLAYAPVMRWYVGLDPDVPVARAHPRGFHGGIELHYGFEVWDGRRFVRRQQVTRKEWPCVRADGNLCDYEPFVTDPGRRNKERSDDTSR